MSILYQLQVFDIPYAASKPIPVLFSSAANHFMTNQEYHSQST